MISTRISERPIKPFNHLNRCIFPEFFSKELFNNRKIEAVELVISIRCVLKFKLHHGNLAGAGVEEKPISLAPTRPLLPFCQDFEPRPGDEEVTKASRKLLPRAGFVENSRTTGASGGASEGKGWGFGGMGIDELSGGSKAARGRQG